MNPKPFQCHGNPRFNKYPEPPPTSHLRATRGEIGGMLLFTRLVLSTGHPLRTPSTEFEKQREEETQSRSHSRNHARKDRPHRQQNAVHGSRRRQPVSTADHPCAAHASHYRRPNPSKRGVPDCKASQPIPSLPKGMLVHLNP
jgi:hypothetical protein